MVQRGEKVEHDERSAVDAETDHFPDIACPRSEFNQNDEACGRKTRSNQMSYAIESFAMVHNALRSTFVLQK
jgi:hypothetical protein